MSASELKRWMETNDKTVVDIASALQLAPDTVRNFLKGKSVNRSTRAAFERLVRGMTPTGFAGAKTATG